MTWAAFLAAMRSGTSQRAGGMATRRGGVAVQQQQPRAAANTGSRSVSSQVVKNVSKEDPPLETWDFIALDVSRLIYFCFFLPPKHFL